MTESTSSTSRLAAVEDTLRNRQETLAVAVARKGLLQEQLANREKEVSDAERASEIGRMARALLEQLTDAKREVVRSKIEDLVTHGIQAVFGSEYSFRIEQKTARNNVTFEYRIVHHFGGQTRESGLRGYHGGGLVALVGFLLRVVMVLFIHPPRRRILFLDETFANLDSDKRDPLARLLLELGQSLEIQFVLITHSEEYADVADKTYEIRQDSGGSKLLPVS